MNFKIGIIATGPMLWERDPSMTKWRLIHLNTPDIEMPLNKWMMGITDPELKVPVTLPLRYAWTPGKGSGVCTLIFSNHVSTAPGRGFIIPVPRQVINSLTLRKLASSLASAGGLWSTGHYLLSNTNGTVALMLHPDIDSKDKTGADIIRRSWVKEHALHESFDHLQYQTMSELPIVSREGFLQIPWTDEMNGFDLLLATVYLPEEHTLLTPERIAERMKQTGTNELESNRKAGIGTFQDEAILACLRELTNS